MPISRCAVAVPVITKGSLHTKNCIREKTIDRTYLTEVVLVNPLVISITNLLNIPLLNELLYLAVKNIFFLKLICSHHAAVSFEYFLVMLYTVHVYNTFLTFRHFNL